MPTEQKRGMQATADQIMQLYRRVSLWYDPQSDSFTWAKDPPQGWLRANDSEILRSVHKRGIILRKLPPDTMIEFEVSVPLPPPAKQNVSIVDILAV